MALKLTIHKNTHGNQPAARALNHDCELMTKLIQRDSTIGFRKDIGIKLNDLVVLNK